MRERMHGPGIDKQIVLFTRIKVPRKRRRQNQKRIRENAPKMFRFVSMKIKLNHLLWFLKSV